MTDNEIRKALERTASWVCDECKFHGEMCDGDKCEKVVAENALDLINRQKEEIDRLNIELQSMRSAANSYKTHYETAKSEAIIEFAERFAKELSEFDMSSVGLPDYDRGYKDCMTAIEDTIDALVKEMTEEKGK